LCFFSPREIVCFPKQPIKGECFFAELADKAAKGLFVWAVAGWLCRESCCAEKAAVQGKLLF
jgi:hypothetical protein